MGLSEWKEYRLADLIEIIGGGTPKTTIPEYWDGEIPWLSVVDFGGGNKYVSDTVKKITKDGLANSSTKVLKKGHLIISARGTVGELAMLEKDMTFNQSCYGLNAKSMTTNNFLYYLIQQNIIELKSKTHGAVFDTITKETFNHIKISLPALKVQHRIASILTSLDDKIELNNQTNQTLEAIAQTLFKEMCVPKGDEMPEGWRMGVFEDVFDSDRGLSYKGSGLQTEKNAGVPMHNLNSIFEKGGYKTAGIKFYSGDYKDKHIVKAGELIIANTEQGHKYMLIGYPAIVPEFYGELGIYSHHIYRLRPKSNSYITPDFAYHLLLQPDIRDQVVGFANGTTVNMLKIEGLQKPVFAMPPKDVVDRFTAVAKFNRLKIQKNILENQTLTALRDSLLPKLMKGEIEVN